MNRHGADDTTEKMAALKNSLQWVWLVLEGWSFPLRLCFPVHSIVKVTSIVPISAAVTMVRVTIIRYVGVDVWC